MNWNYYKPKFSYERTFPDLIWSWAGHKYFIYDFIRNTEPRSIVELGTHKGTSFFSMCQAVKDGKLKTSLYAVDTWKGDKHSGFYDESIFVGVKKIKKTYYPRLRVYLTRKLFDKAVKIFKDESIDLLHIDGLHTYEAVKHDFDTWFSKVKDSGAILLHDTSERKGDFGVYKLWSDMKRRFKTFQFFHSSGLGILFKDPYSYHSLKKFEEEWSSYYPMIYENKLKTHIRKIEGKNIFYKQSLDTITSSRTYKVWQKFCEIRKKILNKNGK